MLSFLKCFRVMNKKEMDAAYTFLENIATNKLVVAKKSLVVYAEKQYDRNQGVIANNISNNKQYDRVKTRMEGHK